ncbi:MAG: hypothetical protein CL581_10895 [Alteromonadaceae bacterium]|nr:hypothetical protein [Alteromonadaceae bacterium]|tara:strand:+ start:3096 stop:4757 length:1662 start_codon:yes stop_codon:yes gene_type:complete
MATPTFSGLSYTFYTGDGSTTNYGTLFNYISDSHVTVTVGGVVKTSGSDYTVVNEAIVFATAPASGEEIRIRRVTPRQYSARAVDFKSFGSITETEMDLNQKQVWFLIQEALEEDDGGEINPNAEYLQYDNAAGNWTALRNAAKQRIANVEAPNTGTDAATKDYVDDIAEFGVAGVPQSFEFTGTGATGDFVLSGGTNLNENYLVVAIEGVVQRPGADFTVIPGDPNSTLSFGTTFPANNTVISVQNFGKARFLNTLILTENSVGSFEIKTDGVTAVNLADNAVDTGAIVDAAVTADKLNASSVTEAKIADESVTFNKLKEAGFVTAPGGSFDQYLKVDKNTGNVSVSTALAADLSDFLTELAGVALNQLGVPTSNLDLNNKRINNLQAPGVAADAATKGYVDSAVGAGTGSKIDQLYTATLPAGQYINTWSGGNPSWYNTDYHFYNVTITNVRWGSNPWIYQEVSSNGTDWQSMHRNAAERRGDTDYPFTYCWLFNLPKDGSTKMHSNFLIGDSGGDVFNHSIYGVPAYHRFRFEGPTIAAGARIIVYGYKT